MTEQEFSQALAACSAEVDLAMCFAPQALEDTAEHMCRNVSFERAARIRKQICRALAAEAASPAELLLAVSMLLKGVAQPPDPLDPIVPSVSPRVLAILIALVTDLLFYAPGQHARADPSSEEAQAEPPPED